MNKVVIARELLSNGILSRFIGYRQKGAILICLRGEEKDFFADKMIELQSIIGKMPKSFEQDGMGDKAIVSLHYFKGGCDWYITERDVDDYTPQAFGMANLGYGGELGYISIDELTQNNIDLDLFWTPKVIAECNKQD